MGLDDGTHEREPEAGAFVAGGAHPCGFDGTVRRVGEPRLCAADEALEDRLLPARWQPAAIVADLDLQPGGRGRGCGSGGGAGRNRDLPSGRRVRDRVVEQVAQHAFHQHGIGTQQGQLIGQLERHGVRAQRVCARLYGAADELVRSDPVEREMRRLRLQAGEVEQVARERMRAQGLGADRLGQLGLGRR